MEAHTTQPVDNDTVSSSEKLSLNPAVLCTHELFFLHLYFQNLPSLDKGTHALESQKTN